MSRPGLNIGLFVMIALPALAEQRWSNDFRTFQQVRALGNVAQRRDYPRIVTRPDVRINRTDPREYRDSRVNKSIGYGWFPVIVRLHSGDLLCIYREGAEHGMASLECRAVVARSRDGGRTWTDAVVIKEKKGHGVSPIFATQTQDGTIWLSGYVLAVAAAGKGTWGRFEMHSTDNGQTWEEDGLGSGYEIGPELSSGELLLLGRAGSSYPWKSNRATVRLRIKDGKVVKMGDPITHLELGPSADEWSVAETNAPGELVAMMRQQQHSRFFATARSDDYGKTWTQWRPSNVYMGCVPSRPVLRRMANGWLIFVYGQRWIGRTFAVASKDNGETWDTDHRLTMLHSPQGYHKSWDSHYPDAAWAEGPYWLAIDYVASPDESDKRGIYGTFLDTRYFGDMHKGLMLKEFGTPRQRKTTGYWRFDELEGEFARDEAHANYGEIRGAQRVAGRCGNALRFDGKDDYVMIYDDASMWVPRYFSLEAWVNTDDAAKEQTILSKAPAYTLGLKGGKPFVEIGRNSLAAEMDAGIESGRWYHLAFVYDTKHNYTRGTFYVDGKDVSYMKPTGPHGGYPETYGAATIVSDMEITGGQTFQEYHAKNRSTDNLVIGMDNDLAARPFHGMIDEVLVHGFELFPEDVRASVARAYVERGVVSTRAITKPAGAKWTTFKADTTMPAGTAIRFDIVDEEGGALVADAKSGAELDAIGAARIVLRAELTTGDPGQTPVLHQWSVGATAGAPTVTTEPFPNQRAQLASGMPGRQVRASAPRETRAPPAVDREAAAIPPEQGLPVDLYQVPTGTTGQLVFRVSYAIGTIEKAWLRLSVDDIDETKEAGITLNARPVAVHESVLGEGEQSGVLVVPVDALVEGKNIFEFVFADDLGGTTEGYSVLAATLLIKQRSEKGTAPAPGAGTMSEDFEKIAPTGDWEPSGRWLAARHGKAKFKVGKEYGRNGSNGLAAWRGDGEARANPSWMVALDQEINTLCVHVMMPQADTSVDMYTRFVDSLAYVRVGGDYGVQIHTTEEAGDRIQILAVADFKVGKWYKIEIQHDFGAHMQRGRVDSGKWSGWVPFTRSRADVVEEVAFWCGVSAENDVSFCIDDMATYGLPGASEAELPGKGGNDSKGARLPL